MKDFLKQNWPFVLLLLYFVFPIDFLPDFLAPIIGPVAYTDDAMVAILLLVKQYINYKEKRAVKKVPVEVIDEKKVLK